MVGGTRIHRQIHERALVEMKEREEFLLGEENTRPAARTLFVSLDRADAIIEGAPDVDFTSGSLGSGVTWVAHPCGFQAAGSDFLDELTSSPRGVTSLSGHT